jgi:plastocyanin
MHAIRPLRSMFAAACAVTLLGCQAGSPAAPSSVTSAAGNVTRPFDDPPVPVPPAPTPTPVPEPAPGVPAPAVPATTTINIVGTFGPSAFDPNPSAAAVGDMVMWTNKDMRVHHIMLEDGTDVGEVAPGASTKPVALANPVAAFYCSLHPSMAGTINGQLPPPQEEPPPYVYRK